jgi:hypothetical protein
LARKLDKITYDTENGTGFAEKRRDFGFISSRGLKNENLGFADLGGGGYTPTMDRAIYGGRGER